VLTNFVLFFDHKSLDPNLQIMLMALHIYHQAASLSMHDVADITSTIDLLSAVNDKILVYCTLNRHVTKQHVACCLIRY